MYNSTNSKWENKPLSGAASEFYSLRYVTNTVGINQFPVATVNTLNAFSFFQPSTADHIWNTTYSTNILEIRTNYIGKILKAGKYRINLFGGFNNGAQVRNQIYSSLSENSGYTIKASTIGMSNGDGSCSWVLEFAANEFIMFGCSSASGSAWSINLTIEYINESSNIIQQITNTGSVTFSSTSGSLEAYRWFGPWNSTAALSGVTNAAISWLNTTAGTSVDNSKNTFWTEVTTYVGAITKAGTYKFETLGGASLATQELILYGSTSVTGPFSAICTGFRNPVATGMAGFSQHVILGTGGFAVPYYFCVGTSTNNTINQAEILITRLPYDSNIVVQANAVNTYVNPSTSAPSFLSITRLFNGGSSIPSLLTPAGYLTINPSNSAYFEVFTNSSDLTFTSSPNSSTISTF